MTVSIQLEAHSQIIFGRRIGRTEDGNLRMAHLFTGKTEPGADLRSHNVTEREEFVNWVATEWSPDDGAELVAKDWPRFAFAAFQAGRRTTPDREAIIAAAKVVVREALDDVCVHPCDEHNDDVRSNSLCDPMRALYLALKTAPNGEKK
jgi:hypothetical protein